MTDAVVICLCYMGYIAYTLTLPQRCVLAILDGHYCVGILAVFCFKRYCASEI